jgi:flagellar hook-associated protein 2
MANASISGLVSGLDTATIIDQLMQLEAVPQTRLQTKQDTQKKVLAALQSLNTDTALLKSKADSLAKPEFWQTLKASSSNPLITLSGSPTTTTSFTVTVDRLATAGQTAYGTPVTIDAVATSGAVTLHTPDNKDLVVPGTDTGTLTLDGLAKAINGMKAGVTAATVRTGTDAATGAPTYRLLLTADKTGAGDKITLSNVTSLGTEDARAGQDAQVSVGTQGIVATSSTNTFTDIVPGVNLTLSAGAVGSIGLTSGSPTTATVTVAQDTAGVKAGVKGLVEQLNKLLDAIDTQTAGKTSTTSAGVLAGDPTARSFRDKLLDTVFGDTGTSMATYGIQTDRYGKVVFDETAFDKAYAADPAGVAAKFTTGATPATDGWIARVATAAKAASDSETGTFSQAITGRKTEIDRLTDSIAAWDDRLELRRTNLQRQYTALETALSSMQSQGNWLAGQIASLPKTSS